MRIQLLSDLHLEFLKYNWHINPTDCDLIVLAGDIGVGIHTYEWAIRESEVLGKPIFMVFGNHELYHDDFSLIEEAKRYTENTNVTVLEKDIVEFMGYRFLGCTLWTDYKLFGPAGKLVAMEAAKQFMADHRMINRYHNVLGFTPGDAAEIFENSFQWLKDNLTGTKDIVITHHAPNHYAINQKYRGDMLSPAFASDLEGFILDRQPLAWFSGHTHGCYRKMIGNTLCTANTKGYPTEGVMHFNPDYIVEV